MSIYKSELQNMSTPCCLLVPSYIKKGGKEIKEFPAVDDTNNLIFFCSFKSFGGTDILKDGIYTVEDTANIFTYFDPKIKSNCRIVRLTDNAVFDIISEPENVDQRNQFLKFKVKRFKGSM